MSNGETIKDILQQIKDHKLEAREGLRRIHELKQRGDAVSGAEQTLSPEAVEQQVKDVLCRVVKLQPEELSHELSFKEMGIDSISSVEIVRDLNEALHIQLDGIVLYDYPTIPELARYMVDEIMKNSGTMPVKGINANAANANPQEQIHEPVQSQRLNHRYEYMNDLINQFSTNKPAAAPSKPKAPFKEPIKASEPATVSPHAARSLKPLTGRQAKEEQAPAAQVAFSAGQPASGAPKLTLKTGAAPIAPAASSTEATGKIKLGFAASRPAEEPVKIMPEAPPGVSVDQAPAAAAEGIAIVGLSGRFPGAASARELWRNLRDGVASTGEIPASRFDIQAWYDEDRKADQKTYCTVAGLLDQVDEFDPLFFNISPKEAEIMDPQQRIFLEEAWKALEDAGYSDQAVQDTRCGVFVGCAPSDYTKHLEANRLSNTADAFTGTSSSILAARISYFLNLKGPSISIDTACSSSLVAVHQACVSLWNEECDMALAGGIRLMITPDSMVQSSQMEILSAQGVCRPFDQEADGTLLSEGAGVVVLKPLKQALENRDHIYGVIRGSGVNQDGRTNGITAPSVNSQIQLEKRVYEKFRIDPAEINYVEAHGTGTALGDPIEVKALTEAFREFTQDSQYCALGSVKANIGHATMAAGVAGMIKILLSLKNRQIPPLIHYNRLNEKIRLEGSPFYINTELVDWPENKRGSRMAAISGFGFSGTNCHIVIEEYRRGSLEL
ncbi:beta-ketoacyl synthase N-terminal-like domain-containing protein [Paenibacillus sp. IHB B 3415]|uniref:type I polyketide synthase n=1 Tax=Paenibacillus sp. IHB B 3415 TaxID=867080 RepID=UPI00069948AD|nr:type I polyketide synthase [Paenibacillus sp. IHB B 3415]